jgi:hypothetical protein
MAFGLLAPAATMAFALLLTTFAFGACLHVFL